MQGTLIHTLSNFKVSILRSQITNFVKRRQLHFGSGDCNPFVTHDGFFWSHVSYVKYLCILYSFFSSVREIDKEERQEKEEEEEEKEEEEKRT